MIAARQFARLNQLNHWRGSGKIGILSAGKPYYDLLQALRDLGLNDGIRIGKVGMPFPLEPQFVRDFADGLSQEPGFAGYQVVATGERTIMSITVFESEAEAERSTELAAQWVADDLADFGVERMGAMTGEVMVSRAASSMLEPAHH